VIICSVCEKIIDQNTALKSIYEKIFLRWPPIVVTNNVPTTGENIIGVRNETPKMPYFRHKVTNVLFRLLNTFLFLVNLLRTQLRILSPAKVRITTVVIIPKLVSRAVSKTVNPAAIPVVGPKINLKELNRYTDRYFHNSLKIQFTKIFRRSIHWLHNKRRSLRVNLPPIFQYAWK